MGCTIVNSCGTNCLLPCSLCRCAFAVPTANRLLLNLDKFRLDHISPVIRDQLQVSSAHHHFCISVIFSSHFVFSRPACSFVRTRGLFSFLHDWHAFLLTINSSLHRLPGTLSQLGLFLHRIYCGCGAKQQVSGAWCTAEAAGGSHQNHFLNFFKSVGGNINSAAATVRYMDAPHKCHAYDDAWHQ